MGESELEKPEERKDVEGDDGEGGDADERVGVGGNVEEDKGVGTGA